MKSSSLLWFCLQNLKRRKSRTLLTISGVMIGTCSIIIMLSLGIAMDESYKEQMSNMGSLNIVEVYSSGSYGPQINTGGVDQARLDDKAVAIFEKISGVEAVMPMKNLYLTMGSGRMVGGVSVVGIRPENLEAFDFKIEEGRLLNEGDKEAIIFGKQVAYSFYNPRLKNQDFMYNYDGPPPVNLINDKLILTADMEYGQRQRTNREADYKPPLQHKVKGVGILKESYDEKDYNAYMNISTLEKILAEDRKNEKGDRSRNRVEESEKYNNIKVKCSDMELVAAVQEEIKMMGYQTYSLTEMLEAMKQTSRTMQAILGGIGAVSLFVAAIGITNTMIMSIYERTREIGVIKVLGADLLDIKKMFLLEAGIIGFMGGLAGVILSYLISFILNQLASGFMEGMGGSAISVIPLSLTLTALAFATLVGLIAGYSPAHRAMNLSALEAIRTE